MDTPTFFDEESWDEASIHDAGDIVADRYDLLTPIGAGGMGVVWRATDLVLRRDVALKLVRADRNHPLLGQRLLTEARAASAVNHPCVLDILDLGTTADGDTYLVMELVDGRELDEQLDHGPLRPREAATIVSALADALVEAHRAGVVHRDIKASNVLMARQDEGNTRPVLIDFGIARLVEASGDMRLTVTGNLLGTPTYMSPEQAAGSKSVDHRTDLWSISVLLYELVAGLPPFEGDSYNEVLKKILMDEPPPLAGVNPEEHGLWPIIARGLEKDVEARWQDAEAFRDAIDAWLLSHGVERDAAGRALSPRNGERSTPPAPPRRSESLHSIDPTVVGLPKATPSPTRPTLTTTLSPRSIVALASVLAATALAIITTRAPAADLGARATLTDAPLRAAAAVTVDGTTTSRDGLMTMASAIRAARPNVRPAPPEATATTATPKTAGNVPEAAVRTAPPVRRPPTATTANAAATPLGLPLPSHPNF